MSKNLVTLIFASLVGVASAAKGQTNAKDGSGSVYVLIGSQSGSGKLLNHQSSPALELGARANAKPEPGRLGFMYELSIAGAKGRAASDQTSYRPDVDLSVFSIGYTPGLCYFTKWVDVCPLGVLQAVSVTEQENRFAYLSLGYGLELAKTLGQYTLMAKATDATLSHKIGGQVESGRLQTVTVGVGYALDAN